MEILTGSHASHRATLSAHRPMVAFGGLAAALSSLLSFLRFYTASTQSCRAVEMLCQSAGGHSQVL